MKGWRKKKKLKRIKPRTLRGSFLFVFGGETLEVATYEFEEEYFAIYSYDSKNKKIKKKKLLAPTARGVFTLRLYASKKQEIEVLARWKNELWKLPTYFTYWETWRRGEKWNE